MTYQNFAYELEQQEKDHNWLWNFQSNSKLKMNVWIY